MGGPRDLLCRLKERTDGNGRSLLLKNLRLGLKQRKDRGRYSGDCGSLQRSRRRSTRLNYALLYWWPGIDCLVKEYIQACQLCLSSDKTANTSAAPLQPVPFPSTPWDKVAVDVVGPFDTAVWDCRYALTLIDYHRNTEIDVDDGKDKDIFDINEEAGLHLVEGDILIQEGEDRNTILDEKYRWPTTVPYVLDSSLGL
ncbi:meprin A subunit beta-like protein [Labeo rohita]|uniref:Meprin A subunit beta-like protein n=1 Tax=Labeo rohita TaxID=84645 RepID=A0A498NP14_LABRO|nr:meprin A subunit beta-like protein [Labeo rohita]